MYTGQSRKVVEEYLGDEKQVQFKELMEDFEQREGRSQCQGVSFQRSRKVSIDVISKQLY